MQKTLVLTSKSYVYKRDQMIYDFKGVREPRETSTGPIAVVWKDQH